MEVYKMIYRENEEIVKEFKKLLIDKGIKQQFVADNLGMSKQSFNQLLGKKHITFDDVKNMLDVIGYNLEINFKPKQ